MAANRKHFIVTYDIGDPLRLARIGKAMKDYGQRVLKSVFECTLDDVKYENMKRKMKQLMELETDSVRYYFICEKCSKLNESIGKRVLLEKEEAVTII